LVVELAANTRVILADLEGRQKLIMEVDAKDGVHASVVRALFGEYFPEQDLIVIDFRIPSEVGEQPGWIWRAALGNREPLRTRSEKRVERALEREARDRFGSGRDRLRTSVGGGLGIIGADQSRGLPQTTPFINLQGSLAARIAFPVSVNVGIGLAFDPRRPDLDADLGRLLPEIRFGIGTALSRTRLQPTLGLVGTISLDRPIDTIILAPSIQGNIATDFMIFPERGVLVSASFSLGVTRQVVRNIAGLWDGVAFPPRMDLVLCIGWRFS